MHFGVPMRAWSKAVLAMLAVAACAGAMAQNGATASQKKEPPPATFELTGVVADAKGPIANKVVRVGPLRAYTDLGNGRMSTTYAVAIVKFDPKNDKVDAGRVVLQPLKPSFR